MNTKLRIGTIGILAMSFLVSGCPLLGISEVEPNDTKHQADNFNKRNYAKDDLISNQQFVGSFSSGGDVDKFHFLTTTADNKITIKLSALDANSEENDECVMAVVKKCSSNNSVHFDNCPANMIVTVATVTTCGMQRRGFTTGFGTWVNRRRVLENPVSSFRVNNADRVFQVAVRPLKPVRGGWTDLCEDEDHDGWDSIEADSGLDKDTISTILDLAAMGGIAAGPLALLRVPVVGDFIVDLLFGEDSCKWTYIPTTEIVKQYNADGTVVMGTKGSRYHFSLTTDSSRPQ